MKRFYKTIDELITEYNITIPDITLYGNSDYDIDNLTISNTHLKRKLLYEFATYLMPIYTTVDDNAHISGAFSDIFSTFIYENQHNFDKIYQSLYAEYNPIENYNKHGDIKETLEYKGSQSNSHTETTGGLSTTTHNDGIDGQTSEVTLLKSGSETNTETISGSETNTETLNNATAQGTNLTETNQVSAFNDTAADSFHDTDKKTTIGIANANTTTNTGTNTNELAYTNRQNQNVRNFNNYTETTQENRHFTDSTNETGSRTGSDTLSFTNRKDEKSIIDSTHGNIGVMSNQTMIEQENLLRAKYNIMNIILNQFAHEFLILA